MRMLFLLFISIFLLAACNDPVIEKPDNLISEDKMVNIIYDLSILEAIRLNNPVSLEQRKINPSQYVYKKYKIDSLQFAKSDLYYASDIKQYSKLYGRVTQKLEKHKSTVDSIEKAKTAPKTEILKNETKPQPPTNENK